MFYQRHLYQIHPMIPVNLQFSSSSLLYSKLIYLALSKYPHDKTAPDTSSTPSVIMYSDLSVTPNSSPSDIPSLLPTPVLSETPSGSPYPVPAPSRILYIVNSKYPPYKTGPGPSTPSIFLLSVSPIVMTGTPP